MKKFAIGDPNIKSIVESKGVKFIRAEKQKENVRIIFTCICGKNEMSALMSDFIVGKNINCVQCEIMHRSDRRTDVRHDAYVVARARKVSATDKKVKDELEKNGHRFIEINREGAKSRIMVKYYCGNCNNGTIKVSAWEVIKRPSFTGCDECSGKRRTENMKNTMQNEAHKASVKEKLFEKHGVTSTLLLPEVKQKMDKTVMEKYKVKNVSQSPVIKKKKRETLESNYGPEPYKKGGEIMLKLENTMMERYNVRNASQVPMFQAKKAHSTYISPNGRRFEYQGFEHLVLKQLIEVDKINEDHIKTEYDLTTTGLMPKFDYIDEEGVSRVYFPDIRLENPDGTFTFVEVKSKSGDYAKNVQRKIDAVRSKGYSVILWVMDKYGNTLKKISYDPITV